MRILAFTAIIGVLVLAIGGCSVTIGGGSGGERHPSGWNTDAGTLAEIDSAAKLTFDNDKEKAFIGIASRPHLSGRAQAYLAKKAMGSLTFDDAKRDVLLALVNNPFFVAEGKQAVLENLDALTFDSSKRKVLEAINQRGTVPTERELQRQLEQHPHPMQPAEEEGSVQMETTIEMEVGYLQKL